MSYQVIARKWRPQAFEEVTGQEAITRALRNAITSGRLHHAYLFAGPRGVGKTTSARLLAKALNCVTGPTATPCGTCPSCTEITVGNSIDVLEIDAASHTGVDNIREVIVNTVANRPARDRYKIFIIDEIHMLSTSAFNALLKTLEEPPSHVIFIMATTELHKLPETILSRCQQYEFRTISVDKIAERLALIAREETITISRDALIQIAHAGRGSMRDAQTAFDQVIAFTGANIEEADVRESLGLIGAQFLGRVVDGLAARDAGAMLALTDELVRTGYDLRQFLRELMSYLRHLLVFNTAGMDRELLPVAESERIQIERQARMFSNEDLVRFFSLLTDIEQNIRLSDEPRYQLEMGLVKLTQLAGLKSLEDILARLEKLSGGGSFPTGGGSGPSTPPPVKPTPSRFGPPPPPVRASAPEAPKPPVTADAAPARPAPPPVPAPEPPPTPIRQVVQPVEAPTPVQKAAPPEPADDGMPPWDDDAPPPEPPDDFSPPEPPRTLRPAPPKPAPRTPEPTRPVPAAPVSSPTVSFDLSRPDAGNALLQMLKTELETRRKMILLTQLDVAERAELKDDDFILHFHAGKAESKRLVDQPREQIAIQDVLKGLTGKKLNIKTRLAGGGGPVAMSEADVQRAALRKQAEGDPLVQALVKTFRGEIADVTPPA
jgi:DNA polymerase-3 subunit gamma/tau